MGCNSLIYTANSEAAAIPVGGMVPLGTVVRRFGCNCQLSGNGIVCQGNGYYKVDADVVLTPTAAGTVTVTLLSDGVPVPGATASATVAAAATTVTLPIDTVVRNRCCDDSQTLTLQVTGAASALVNVAVVVEKV